MKKILTLSVLLLSCFIAIHAEKISITFTDEDTEVFSSSTANLTVDANGNLVIENFLSSGYPLVFNFSRNIETGDLDIITLHNYRKEEARLYLTTPDGKDDLEGEVTKDGKTLDFARPFLIENQNYIKRLAPEETEGAYNYQAVFTLSGYLDDASVATEWIQMSFFFNIPDETEKPTPSMKVNVTVDDGKGNICQEYESTLTRNADGSYTLENLMNLRTGLTFFYGSELGVGSSAVPYLGGNVQDYGKFYCLVPHMITDSPYAAYIPDENGENSIYVDYILAYEEKIEHLDWEEAGSDFTATFIFQGRTKSSKDDDYEIHDRRVSFSYDELEIPESESAKSSIVQVRLFNGVSPTGPLVAEGTNTTITTNGDDTYTVKNFLDCGSPLSFTFNHDIAEHNVTHLKVVGNVDDDIYRYHYILNSAGERVTGIIYNINSDIDKIFKGQTEIKDMYVINSDFTFVSRVNPDESNGYNFIAHICVSGVDSKGKDLPHYFVAIFFNAEASNNPSGIEDVNTSVSGNSSPEYFNLQGIKVTKPEKGVYIRRQGSDATKVYIR